MSVRRVATVAATSAVTVLGALGGASAAEAHGVTCAARNSHQIQIRQIPQVVVDDMPKAICISTGGYGRKVWFIAATRYDDVIVWNCQGVRLARHARGGSRNHYVYGQVYETYSAANTTQASVRSCPIR